MSKGTPLSKLLDEAAQLCEICTDWNLDEAQIDGKMRKVSNLRNRFRKGAERAKQEEATAEVRAKLESQSIGASATDYILYVYPNGVPRSEEHRQGAFITLIGAKARLDTIGPRELNGHSSIAEVVHPTRGVIADYYYDYGTDAWVKNKLAPAL